MRVLIDICHPAHVHFYKNVIDLLRKNNHEIYITSREKDITENLLNQLDIVHNCISTAPRKASIFSFAKELIIRETRLLKITKYFKPDVMTAIGGIFVAHVGRIANVKSIIYYDTENANLQNLLTYPFVQTLVVPQCYNAWTPIKKTIRYSGYHELSYLHPNRFSADKSVAIKNGINPHESNFLLRIVSWSANHDINESGWTDEFLYQIVSLLSKKGNVLISTERILPNHYNKYLYKGTASMLHHVLAFCSLYVGESATIASEAVVLGVPSVYVANTSRGYVDEQEKQYCLAKVVKQFSVAKVTEAIENFLDKDNNKIKEHHHSLLANTVDVTQLVYNQLIS